MSTRSRSAVLALGLGLVACGPGRGVGSGSGTGESTQTSGLDGSGTETSASEDSETGVSEVDCLLAIRLDLCCNQPFAATPAEVEAEDCVVGWPIDEEAVPAALVLECGMAQPDWCEVVDCNYAEPASEIVGLNADGECAYLCGEDLSLAYRTPGCGTPPPVVECLGIPPPCADEYCSCAGETIWGCGQVSEPFEHVGACE
jgi:hypothetical protein